MRNNLTAKHIKYSREFKSIKKRKLVTTVDNAAGPTLMMTHITTEMIFFTLSSYW